MPPLIMKKCSKCGKIKDDNSFYKGKVCKDCARAIAKEYQSKHRLLSQRKKYYYDRPENCYCEQIDDEDEVCMYCGLEISRLAKKYKVKETDIIRF